MRTDSTSRPAGRPAVLGALIWWAAGLLLVIGAHFLFEPSKTLHLAIGDAEVAAPDHLASGTIILLALLLAVVTWCSRPWRTWRDVTGVAAGVGVVIAYASSELLKALFAQVRPCRSVLLAPGCPEAGNWSFPSNHSTIAFGIATAIVLVVARWWAWSVYLLALAAAVSRVIDGVHYPHDVFAGAALGICTTVAVTQLLLHTRPGRVRHVTRDETAPS